MADFQHGLSPHLPRRPSDRENISPDGKLPGRSDIDHAYLGHSKRKNANNYLYNLVGVRKNNRNPVRLAAYPVHALNAIFRPTLYSNHYFLTFLQWLFPKKGVRPAFPGLSPAPEHFLAILRASLSLPLIARLE